MVKETKDFQSELDKQKKEADNLKKNDKNIRNTFRQVETYLENIQYQSNMLITLINDLMDLAKFETMNFSFNEDYFNMNDLIK